jgi:hypothetical protein
LAQIVVKITNQGIGHSRSLGGGRLVRRRSHPAYSGSNVAEISVFGAVSLVLIFWALSG